MRRSTYLQRRFPDTPVFQDIARRWCADRSTLLLGLVWRAYDLLVEKDLKHVPLSLKDEAKEETLNSLLSLRMHQCKSGDEPFDIQHQVPEQTKRKPGPGRSPQPDIGFVLYGYPRTVWPLEGKVLLGAHKVRDYVDDLNMNMLTGRYATFSGEGAMVGYLLCGELSIAFQCIETELKCRLESHPRFLERPHKTSHHQRSGLPSSESPSLFCCHHLIMEIPTE